MRDEILPAKDVAVYWIEHVLRQGGTRHLQSSARTMPFYQQYLIDVWLFLSTILAVTCLIIYKVSRWIIRKLLIRGKIKEH